MLSDHLTVKKELVFLDNCYLKLTCYEFHYIESGELILSTSNNFDSRNLIWQCTFFILILQETDMLGHILGFMYSLKRHIKGNSRK